MQTFANPLHIKCFGLFLLTIFMVGFLSGEAQANSSWKDLKGYSACGGLDKNGKLQEPCAFERAKFEKKALGKCPTGSFFDLSTWSCYSCPKGYNRNAKSISGDKACDKAVTPQTSKAKFESKKQCPNGSFLDPRNGGECWSCPSGLGRTAAGVDKWNACGKIGKKAASAIFKGKSCPKEGSFTDPRNGGECWICPEGYNRTADSVTGAKACIKVLDFKAATKAAALTCEVGQHFDFIDGGTCWSCPESSDRTLSSVKSSKACRNTKMKWVTPTRTMYGLFGLGSGADDILAELIANRTEIDDIVKEAAKNGNVSQEKALTSAWDLIDTKPWESSYLSILLAQRAIDTAKKPVSQRSDSEKKLLDSVTKIFQWNRQFIAQQAKQAHESWVKSSKLFYEERAKEMGAAIIYSDSMVTPPDYNEMIANTIQGSAGASMVGSVIAGAFLPKFAYMIPYKKIAILAIKEAAKPGPFLTTGGSGMSGVAGAAAAPAAIAVAISVIVTMEIDKYAKLAKAEGEIRQAIDISNRPVDLALLLQQEKGKEEFWLHWNTAISEKVAPSAYFKKRIAELKSGAKEKPAMPTINFPSVVVQPTNNSQAMVAQVGALTMQTSKNSPGSNWLLMKGQASDIASGSDGTIYIVSTEKRTGGFFMYERAQNSGKWSKMSHGAIRIAAEGDKAWMVNDKGDVYVESNTGGWVKVNAPTAQDIGASAKAVWIVGTDGKIYKRDGNRWKPFDGRAVRIDCDTDGRPWVVTKEGNVFVHDNNFKWQKVSGLSAIDISADLPGEPQVVAKDGSIYTYSVKSRKWASISKGVELIAIGAGAKQVFAVNKMNEIFRLK